MANFGYILLVDKTGILNEYMFFDCNVGNLLTVQDKILEFSLACPHEWSATLPLLLTVLFKTIWRNLADVASLGWLYNRQ